VSEDFSIWIVGLRRFVTLCKTAPYRNSLTYLLTYLLDNNKPTSSRTSSHSKRCFSFCF